MFHVLKIKKCGNVTQGNVEAIENLRWLSPQLRGEGGGKEDRFSRPGSLCRGPACKVGRPAHLGAARSLAAALGPSRPAPFSPTAAAACCDLPGRLQMSPNVARWKKSSATAAPWRPTDANWGSSDPRDRVKVKTVFTLLWRHHGPFPQRRPLFARRRGRREWTSSGASTTLQAAVTVRGQSSLLPHTELGKQWSLQDGLGEAVEIIKMTLAYNCSECSGGGGVAHGVLVLHPEAWRPCTGACEIAFRTEAPTASLGRNFDPRRMDRLVIPGLGVEGPSLDIEQREPVSCNKTSGRVANDKIQKLKQKLWFLENICHNDLDSFPNTSLLFGDHLG